jgi:hypothetical protein
MTFSTSTLCHWRIQSLDRILQIAQFRGHAYIHFGFQMASLVDSRPNSSSTPPIHYSASPSYPGTYSPPIKTTTNALPPAPQSQPQMATSIPTTPGLEIPGAFPREKNTISPETSGPGPAPRQSAPVTYLLPRAHSCNVVSDRWVVALKLTATCSRCKYRLAALDREGRCQAGGALRRRRPAPWLHQ